MANHNGRTERDDALDLAKKTYQRFAADSDNTEHGYQDPRDQRDGRDDVRGGDFANQNFQATDRNDSNARNDRSERDRPGGDTAATGPRGGAQLPYRGQSGSHAGDMYGTPYRGPASRGGNDGHWGDFDRGGQSSRQSGGTARETTYDTQSPQYGAQDMRSSRGGYADTAQPARGAHAGKGPKGFTRSDERILELVHEVLTDHEHVDASNITVNVKDGEVTLSGHVDHRSAKLQAEDRVATVSGVKDVHNQLRVQPAKG